MMTVDGEDFRIRARAEEPGVYDFEWLSGPHDHSFTSAIGDRLTLTPGEAEQQIRGFLTRINPTRINPATAYID